MLPLDPCWAVDRLPESFWEHNETLPIFSGVQEAGREREKLLKALMHNVIAISVGV
jgi:hypothetical protein